jgi:predicted TIM-barrel enzyme
MLEAMVQYTSQMKEAFTVPNAELDAIIMENLFDISYNIEGSNHRDVENQIIAYFQDFLQDCESKIHLFFAVIKLYS